MNQSTSASDKHSPLQPFLNRDTPDPALAAALNTLRTGDFQTRWEIAKTIPTFGDRSIAPLLTLLEEEDESDWELLWFVARILGNLEHAAAIPALLDLLKMTDNPEVAAMGITALANTGVDAIPALTDLLVDPSTRLLAVQALAQIHHIDVIPALQNAAQEPSSSIRVIALEALSYFYDPSIEATLLAALTDPIAAVRCAAVTGLGLQANLLDRSALVTHLQPLLWDLNLSVCQQTAIALARISTDEAATLLFQVLQSPHTPDALQLEVIRALSWIGTDTALGYLQQFLQQQSEEPHTETGEQIIASEQQSLSPPSQNALASPASYEVVAALGRVPQLAQVTATEILLALLQSTHPITREAKGKQAIAFNLGQLGQLTALDALINLLADEDKRVQFHTIAALKQLNATIAYQQLEVLATRQDLSQALQAGVAIALREWNIHSMSASR